MQEFRSSRVRHEFLKSCDTYDDEKGWVETGFLQSKKETAQGFYYEFMDCKYVELFNVTHWQPLPKAPK